MIDNIIFDVGGVLTDYHQNDYFLNKGYSGQKAEQLKNATQLHPDWKEYDRGVLTDEEVRARFKKDASELSEDIDNSLSTMNGLVTMKSSSVPWVRFLKKKGFHLYILSNFSKTAYRDCHKELEFENYMDNCFWSFHYHVIKPDDACFATMLYEFHLEPSVSVFIDDTKTNLQAAQKFGIHTILYQNQAQAEQDLKILLHKENIK